MTCSIIIPTLNRPEALARCVAACRRLVDPGGGIEIVVVDDGSEPPVTPMEGVAVIRQSNGGPARARNTGLRAARGTMIAFIDDDCVPDTHWVTELWKAHREHPGALLGGLTRNGLPRNVFSATSQFLVDFLYEFFLRKMPQFRFFTSNNCAAGREALLARGGFDEAFPLAAAEDRDLGERFEALVYVAGAVVRHEHELDWRGFWRQHFNYGRGAVHLAKARERRGVRAKWAMNYFYPALLRAPFVDAGVERPLAICALLSLSQVAAVVGFVYECAVTLRARRG